uniref:Uncharacterized protein n=1 Tax=Anguilla anguilla TaxID=7936 RepID=A0A0E9VR35_ANGAN
MFIGHSLHPEILQRAVLLVYVIFNSNDAFYKIHRTIYGRSLHRVTY